MTDRQITDLGTGIHSTADSASSVRVASDSLGAVDCIPACKMSGITIPQSTINGRLSMADLETPSCSNEDSACLLRVASDSFGAVHCLFSVRNVRHHDFTVHHEWLTVKSLIFGQELVLQQIQQVRFE